MPHPGSSSFLHIRSLSSYTSYLKSSFLARTLTPTERRRQTVSGCVCLDRFQTINKYFDKYLGRGITVATAPLISLLCTEHEIFCCVCVGGREYIRGRSLWNNDEHIVTVRGQSRSHRAMRSGQRRLSHLLICVWTCQRRCTAGPGRRRSTDHKQEAPQPA